MLYAISVFSYRQVEGKVVEIARLQEIIADKVLEQVILCSMCLPVVGLIATSLHGSKMNWIGIQIWTEEFIKGFFIIAR